MGSLLSFSYLIMLSTMVLLILLPRANTASDYTSLVYKGCSEQKYTDASYSQTITSLFSTLLLQSQNTSFASATSGQGQTSFFGLYQCRGDLATSDCHACVLKVESLSNNLCGNSVAGRIQLNGCYLRYEVNGFKQVSNTELLYKVCGGKNVGADFESKRDTALGMVASGVGSGVGFYTGSYESALFVLGQCEGDLNSGDCSDCVKAAIDDVKADCGDAVSGQVYLHKCYVTYAYYANGVPSVTDNKSPSSGTKNNAQKTVAIVIGGVAALGFLVACLLFIKSVFKKKKESKHRGGGHY